MRSGAIAALGRRLGMHLRGGVLRRVPQGVDPAKAIQQTKWDTTVEWITSLVMPWGGRRDLGSGPQQPQLPSRRRDEHGDDA